MNQLCILASENKRHKQQEYGLNNQVPAARF